MLQKRIDEDLKVALKQKDAVKVSTLRMLKAAIRNACIEKRTEKLGDEDVIKIISRQIKQHRDSIDGFTKGDRMDLVEKEKAELAILASYMPEQLSSEELMKVVKEAIANAEAKGKSDLGRVMKLVMLQVKGRAEGKLVSELVSAELQKLEGEEKEEKAPESK